jgi:DNA-binding NtrC family response regulator
MDFGPLGKVFGGRPEDLHAALSDPATPRSLREIGQKILRLPFGPIHPPEVCQDLIRQIQEVDGGHDDRGTLLHLLYARTAPATNPEIHPFLHQEVCRLAPHCRNPMLVALPDIHYCDLCKARFSPQSAAAAPQISSDNPWFFWSAWTLAYQGLCEPLLARFDALPSLIRESFHARPNADTAALPGIRVVSATTTGNCSIISDLIRRLPAIHAGSRMGSALFSMAKIPWYIQRVLAGELPGPAEIAAQFTAEELTHQLYRDHRDYMLTPVCDLATLTGIAACLHDTQRLLSGGILFAYLGVRAAILLGQTDQVQQALQSRRLLGHRHYLDHLHAMRTDLLRGEHASAATHYHQLREMAAHYSASNRIEVELRTALELRLTDLVDLAQPPDVAVPDAVMDHRSTSRIWRRTRAETFVGDSSAAARIRERIGLLAGWVEPVFITGAAGSGRRLVARLIHHGGATAPHPFLTLNADQIDDGLLLTALCGQDRSPLHPHLRRRRGLLATAGKGSLLLTHFDRSTPFCQQTILALLENREFRAAGETRPRPLRCRLLFTAGGDHDGTDAIDRLLPGLRPLLQGTRIDLPSLDERREDLPALVRHLLRSRRLTPVRLRTITAACTNRSSWPGNVRELRDFAETLAMADGGRADRAFLSDVSRCQRAVQRQEFLRHQARATPNTKERQRQRLGAAFQEHGRLTRPQVMGLLNIPPGHASRLLRDLAAAGIIRKVTPNRSPVSHYWERVPM